MMNTFDFLQETEPEPGVTLWTLDLPGRKVNTLGKPVFEALLDRLDSWDEATPPRGLLLRSGKPGQFIAGADLREIQNAARAGREHVKHLIDLGRLVFDRLADLPCPTISLIDGPSLGGGVELALATDVRIVSDSERTTIGLPEVRLGLIPSWGGTQRLPRLIGEAQAIHLISGGEALSSAEAVELGLADARTTADDLVAQGMTHLHQMIESGQWREDRQQRRGRTTSPAKAGPLAVPDPDNPAPEIAERVIREGGRLVLADGLERESAAALDLFLSPEAARRITAFLTKNAPK